MSAYDRQLLINLLDNHIQIIENHQRLAARLQEITDKNEVHNVQLEDILPKPINDVERLLDFNRELEQDELRTKKAVSKII